MVAGPLRGVLWLLGGLASAWLLLSALSLPAMGRMMGSGGMMSAGPSGGEMMGDAGGMTRMFLMMLAMGAGLIALLDLVGVFVYLVVDSFRRRSASRAL